MKLQLIAVYCFAVSLSFSAFAASPPAPALFPEHAEPPDPLVTLDGTRITTKEGWEARRAPELRELFQSYMYGMRPTIASEVEGKLLREDEAAFGGKATLREVLVKIGLDEPVHLLIVVPNKRDKPAPCFLGINFFGNHALVADPKVQLPGGWVPEKFAGEAGRGAQAEAWAIEQSIDRGYAVASFYHGDIVPDKTGLAEERLKRLLPGEITADDGEAPATIMAWAWGFSRMIDYLEKVPEINAGRIAVVGHSRNGKATLVAAAFDDRIALAIPSQAGCGGTAPSRVAPELSTPDEKGRPKVETLPVINKAFPHWFCANFKAFNETPEKLPFDQHSLIALCAPRPVLLSNAAEDQWANPAGQFAMLQGADRVYRLVAAEGLDAFEMPEPGKLVASRLGWFIRPGKHAMTREDWAAWLDYADKWLR